MQRGRRQSAEGAAETSAVEHGHLELLRGQRAPLLVGTGLGQGAHGQPQAVVERHVVDEALTHDGADRLGHAAHHHEGALVEDRPVVGQPVHLVGLGRVPHLGDDDLDLVRLGLLGEDRAEGLRVGVGQRPPGDVTPVVRVAPQVGEAHAGHPEVLELVVLADRGEGQPVVDLAHLVQRGRAVLGHHEDAVGVGQDDDAAAARDALAGEIGAVLHQLFWRDVERGRHGRRLSDLVRDGGSGQPAAGPSGRAWRCSIMRPT